MFEPAEPIPVPAEVVVDHLRQEHVTAADALREKPPLRDLGLALAVDLAGQALRTDLFPVTTAMLVEVADPPDAGALRVLVDATGAALTGASLPVVALIVAHVHCPRTARTRG